MENTGILTTIAGVAMSFVGFTGLLITLRGGAGRGQLDEFEHYQLMAVVAVSLTVLFGSVGLIVFADLLGRDDAMRVTSAGLALVTLINGSRSRRRLGKMAVATLTQRESLLFSFVAIAAVILFLACVVTPVLALFELALLLLLAVPALVFRYVLTHLARKS